MKKLIYLEDAISAISVSAFSINTVYGRSERGMKALQDAVMALKALPSAEPEVIRCKDCNKASKCYGDVIMRSRGGGNIYCPLEFCSEAERRTDE